MTSRNFGPPILTLLLLRPQSCLHKILDPLPPKTMTSIMDDPSEGKNTTWSVGLKFVDLILNVTREQTLLSSLSLTLRFTRYHKNHRKIKQVGQANLLTWAFRPDNRQVLPMSLQKKMNHRDLLIYSLKNVSNETSKYSIKFVVNFFVN